MALDSHMAAAFGTSLPHSWRRRTAGAWHELRCVWMAPLFRRAPQSTAKHTGACAQAPRAIEQEQEALLKVKYGALQPKKKLLPKARPCSCSCPVVRVTSCTANV